MYRLSFVLVRDPFLSKVLSNKLKNIGLSEPCKVTIRDETQYFTEVVDSDLYSLALLGNTVPAFFTSANVSQYVGHSNQLAWLVEGTIYARS